MSYVKQYDFNLKSEINFKALETYEGLLRDHESGLITAAQMDCAISALSAAVGWAVDKSLFAMLSEPVERDDSFTLKTFLSRIDQPVDNSVMVSTDIVSGKVFVRSGRGLLSKRVYEADTDREAAKLYQHVVWKLKNSYKEIR